MNWENPWSIPLYSIPDAARYLRIPQSTLRAWCRGQKDSDRETFFRPIFQLEPSHPPRMSFINLIEAYVVNEIRRKYDIRLPMIRKADEVIRQLFKSTHPFVDEKIEIDGKNIIVRSVLVTQKGQMILRELIKDSLERIDWEKGLPFSLYPYLELPGESAFTPQQPKLILINPTISFGRPVISGSRVPTEILADRFLAGEKPIELAEDYELSEEEIKAAINWELNRQAA